jgi:hypothetical protein
VRFFDDFKLAMISLFVFVAWVASSEGLVRAVAALWLVYPAVYAVRFRRRIARD